MIVERNEYTFPPRPPPPFKEIHQKSVLKNPGIIKSNMQFSTFLAHCQNI